MFDVILADPPWQYGSRGARSGKFAELDYPTMTIEEIANLPVSKWAAKDAALFMWVTGSFLEDALTVGKSWGFNFTRVDKTWVKQTSKGGRHGVVGPWGMTDVEYLLLFTRGKICGKQAQRNQFVAQLAEYPGVHSRKPAIFRNMIEQRFHQDVKRLELFSREQVPGWTVIGNAIDGQDIRDVLNAEVLNPNKLDNKVKHIISFSGGAASFTAAHTVAEKHGVENVILAFCDTLIEDGDLYRFIVEGAAKLYDIALPAEILAKSNAVPPISNPERTSYIQSLSKEVVSLIPNFAWLIEGRDPWEVFKDIKYVGNTRIAHCTIELKGKTFARWLTDHYSPDECVIHFGFDWSEEHRLETARKNWAPYKCEAVLCAPPYLSRSQVFQTIDDYDMETPRLYEMGFAHNNCGGFCVKAGQAHFENLLRKMPEVYAYHEARQEKLIAELPTVRPFLRMTKNKVTSYLTLKQFREHLQSGGEWAEFEYGGCGCFSDTSAEGIASLCATKMVEEDNIEAENV